VEAVEDLTTVDITGEEGAPGEEEQVIEEAVEGVIDQEIAVGQPQPLGTESDIYCAGFITAEDISFPYQIIGSEYEALTSNLGNIERGKLKSIYGSAETLRFGMATGDIVYVGGGRQAGLGAGSELTIVETGETVVHPVSGKVVGRQYHFTGRLRILSVQETTAIAEISYSCDPVLVGSDLQPFVPEPVPLARLDAMRPINLPPSIERLENAPVILSSQDHVVALGEDHVVFIDRGSRDEITPGDIFSIYRMHRRGLPPVLVGELAVLAVYEESSVARIIRSRHTIYVGDRLEPK